jgi:hypothetical protein
MTHESLRNSAIAGFRYPFHASLTLNEESHPQGRLRADKYLKPVEHRRLTRFEHGSIAARFANRETSSFNYFIDFNDPRHFGADMEKDIRLVASRIYAFLDPVSLQQQCARDTLFRFANSFLLHMSAPGSDDRLVRMDSRSALVWLNAGPEEFGLEWQ